MASPPTVVTSRRRQHELLRSWTGWPLTSILIDPTEVAQVRETGWSGTHHRDPETGERIVVWVRCPKPDIKNKAANRMRPTNTTTSTASHRPSTSRCGAGLRPPAPRGPS